MTYWSTRSAVVACGATETCTGSWMNWAASCWIAFGMVAEKNRVWRFAGSIFTICLSAWMKPRSIIWSASSRTRISTSRRVSAPCSIRSIRRPGVATSTSTPRATSARFLRDRGAAEHGGDARCRRTGRRRGRCRRSGRRARGSAPAPASGRRAGWRGGRPRASRSIDGSMKAAVLPVPVWAMPSRSRPGEHGRDGLRWIGVGSE